jgi:hypothetical protein
MMVVKNKKKKISPVAVLAIIPSVACLADPLKLESSKSVELSVIKRETLEWVCHKLGRSVRF